MNSLENRWMEMLPPPDKAAFQRIDPDHPLDFYIGKEPSGEWMLLLVSDDRPPAPAGHCASIGITARKRDDGRWALVFRLEKTELQKLFAIMCDDIVEATRSSHDKSMAAASVMTRFARWQRLLERKRTGILGEREMRGLMGELVFLEKLLEMNADAQGMVSAWVGPDGADRDFAFPAREFEIKAIPPAHPNIVISSAEQLDLDGKELFLAVVGIDKGDFSENQKSFTPLSLVERLRHKLEDKPNVLDLFDMKLLEAGFLPLDEYTEHVFMTNGTRYFRVEGEFPRILRSRLPPGIGKVTWELELNAIQPFESNPWGDNA